MPHPALTTGQTAVISGAASGIGLAAAKAMAARGMAVALLDLPGDRLTAAAQQITDLGARALAIGLDVADPAAYATAASTVAAQLPPVSFLMNNAGMGLPSSTLSDPATWMRTLGTNLWGSLCAAVILMLITVLALVALFQRQVIRGLTMGTIE